MYVSNVYLLGGFKKTFRFELFTKVQELSMKIVMELVRNSQKTLEYINSDILVNFSVLTPILSFLSKYVHTRWIRKGTEV